MTLWDDFLHDKAVAALLTFVLGVGVTPPPPPSFFSSSTVTFLSYFATEGDFWNPLCFSKFFCIILFLPPPGGRIYIGFCTIDSILSEGVMYFAYFMRKVCLFIIVLDSYLLSSSILLRDNSDSIRVCSALKKGCFRACAAVGRYKGLGSSNLKSRLIRF